MGGPSDSQPGVDELLCQIFQLYDVTFNGFCVVILYASKNLDFEDAPPPCKGPGHPQLLVYSTVFQLEPGVSFIAFYVCNTDNLAALSLKRDKNCTLFYVLMIFCY